jgi:hypothetical protein
MCYDMQTNKQGMETSVASVNTRDIIFNKDHHDIYPVIDFPEEYRIDTKPFVNRPFFVDSVVWSNEVAYSFLTSKIVRLPRDVFTSNVSLETALKLGAYFRSDLSLNISVAGTISHAGVVLVGVLPPMPNALSTNRLLVNTLMSGPHCFLNANEATSCVLHVPWYCNTDVASLDIRPTAPTTVTALSETNVPGNFATLALMVLNPLSASASASTSLNITIEACFSSLDIYVPSPKYFNYDYSPAFQTQGLQSIATTAIDSTTTYAKQVVGDAIDVVRKGIKYYTGLHNPNVPLINNRMIVTNRNFPNNTTGDQFFEKLDPYPEIDRVVDRPIFNTAVDEMSIRHILSKPQYLGTCKVFVDDAVGKLKWARPISPFQGGLAGNGQIVRMANNIELLHRVSRAWRGSLKIHIQSVMNNKQQVKLRLIQLYNPPAEILRGKPVYDGLLSAPSHLLEFTGGGQIQTVTLPYLCRNQLTPCTPNMDVEALFHGMYYVYVAQPLVISSDSPTGVSFNFYMSGGDDLTFHGYATEVINQYALVATPVVDPPVEEEKDTSEILGNKYYSQGLTVMNEPQKDTTLGNYSTSIDTNVSHQERLYSPIDIRPIIRRMYQLPTHLVNVGVSRINLDTYIGERLLNDTGVSVPQLISSMYYGKSLGVKIKLKVYGTFTADDFTVMFVPPQVTGNLTQKVLNSCNVSPRPEFAPDAGLNVPGYPFPFIEMAQNAHGPSKVYEFVVPNTTFYKFIGGPEKFAIMQPTLSVADFGSIIIWSKVATQITLYAGYTDESRLGFHSIAPIFGPIKRGDSNNQSASAYLGDAVSNDIAPSRILNSFLYYTD